VVLRSPVIKADKKEKILDALTLDRMSPITTAFCHLLVRKNREGYLPDIAAAFIDQYKKSQGIQLATLTTAAPASPELIARLVEKIKEKIGVREVELRTVVQEDLIGGFILEVGDELVDSSIAYDLKNIQKQFQDNEFIYQIR
jgi:F-type H+-transporting ATPase subunit delta